MPGYDVVPGATGSKEVFDRLPNRCVTAPASADPGCSLQDIGVGIDGSHRVTASLESGKIREIITHERGAFRTDTESLLDTREGGRLVGNMLEHDLDAQLRHAVPKGLATTAGDHRDPVALTLPGLDREPVSNVKALQLAARGVKQDRTVGHHAIDVETEQLDVRGIDGMTGT